MPEKLKLSKKNFSEWWNKIISYAKILDDRYPVKGVYVWMPYGYKALKLMISSMENLLENSGHKEAYFPLFSPLSIFSKEKEFLEGFSGESLRVTKIGRRKLDEELIVRPTSETIIYFMFSLWVRSWRDLPLKIYQTVPIFRWETKMTKPMFRCREVVKFNEAHCVLPTKEEADEQVREAIEIYKKFFKFLLIPHIVLKTPKWDTFSGAMYNYDFFTVMPDGKGLELGSVINLGQKFAKTYKIQYLDKIGKKRTAWQVTYGISERALGATLAIHGDDKGLIFPSKIAPIQVVVVPILKGKKNDKDVLKFAKNLKLNFRVFVDTSEITPGEKFNHWEAKGVPIRIEIGEKELKERTALIVRRDNGNKKSVPVEYLDSEIGSILKDIDKNILKKAENFLKSVISEAKNLKVAEKVLKNGGIVKLPWCGSDKCGKDMQEKLVGSALGVDEKEKAIGKCVCGRGAKHMLYFARTY